MQNSVSISGKIHEYGNILGVWVISIILLVAFYFQFVMSDLPCPLCLLQRMGFVAVGVALSMNVRFGAKPSYYGLAILAALTGFGVAARQVLLHIHPNDPGFGSPLWGVHFYSWAAVCFFVITIVIAIALQFCFDAQSDEGAQAANMLLIRRITLWVFAIIVLANLISTFTECGFGQCPDNPTTYWLLNS